VPSVHHIKAIAVVLVTILFHRCLRLCVICVCATSISSFSVIWFVLFPSLKVVLQSTNLYYCYYCLTAASSDVVCVRLMHGGWISSPLVTSTSLLFINFTSQFTALPSTGQDVICTCVVMWTDGQTWTSNSGWLVDWLMPRYPSTNPNDLQTTEQSHVWWKEVRWIEMWNWWKARMWM
jgi:hypothetical protein